MAAGTEPITDEELLYRRIPESTGWYNGQSVDRMAFNPVKNDLTGLSLSRAKYKSLEEAAQGRAGKRYFVAVLRMADLRAQGIEVEPAPLPDDPGHAEIRSLTYDDRKSDQARDQMLWLATKLCLRIEGPFPPVAEP